MHATLNRLVMICLMTLIASAFNDTMLNGDASIAEIQNRGYFDLALHYNETSHLWMIPLYFGFHPEDFEEPFFCALDFTIPSILVPSNKCKNCVGKQYIRNGTQEFDKKNFTYPHSMMYWKYTNGSFIVREEEQMLVLGYDPHKHLKD